MGDTITLPGRPEVEHEEHEDHGEREDEEAANKEHHHGTAHIAILRDRCRGQPQHTAHQHAGRAVEVGAAHVILCAGNFHRHVRHLATECVKVYAARFGPVSARDWVA